MMILLKVRCSIAARSWNSDWPPAPKMPRVFTSFRARWAIEIALEAAVRSAVNLLPETMASQRPVSGSNSIIEDWWFIMPFLILFGQKPPAFTPSTLPARSKPDLKPKIASS